MPGFGRRLGARSAGALVLAAAAAAALVAADQALQLPAARATGGRALAQLLQAASGQPARVTDARLRLLPPGLTAAEVVVEAPVPAWSRVAAVDVEVRLRPWPNRRGRAVLSKVRVGSLAVAAAPAAQAEAAAGRRHVRLPVDVTRATLAGGDVALALAGGVLYFRDLRATLAEVSGGRRLTAAATVGMGGRDVAPLALTTAVSGDLDRPRALLGLVLEAGDERAWLRGRGRVDLLPAIDFDLDVAAGGDAGRASELAGLPPPPAAAAWELVGRIAGAPQAADDVAADGILTATIGGGTLGGLRAGLRASRRGVSVDEATWEVPGGGVASGSLDVAASAGWPIRADLRLEGLAWPPALGDLSGSATLVGTLRPLAAQVEVDLAATAPAFPAAARTLVARGTAAVAPRQLSIGQLTLTAAPAASLRVQGALTMPRPTAGWAAQLRATGVAAPAALFPSWSGPVDLTATVSGPLDDLAVGLQARAPALAVGPGAVADLDFALRWRRDTLSLGPARARVGAGEVRASGSLAWAPGHLPGAGHLALRLADVEAADLLAAAGAPAALARAAAARWTGSLHLGRGGRGWTGTGELATGRLAAGTARLGPAQLSLRWGGGTRLSARLAARPAQHAHITARAQRFAGGAMDLMLQARAVPVASLLGERVGLDGPAGGDLDADVGLQGAPTTLAGSINVLAHRPRLGGWEAERLHACGAVAKSVWQARLEAEGVPHYLHLRLGLADRGGFALTGVLRDLDLGALAGRGRALGGRTDADVFAHGTLLNWRRARGEVRVRRLRLERGKLALVQQQPFSLVLGRGLLSVRRDHPVVLALAPPWGLTVSGEGRYQLGGAVDASADVIGDLGFVAALDDRIEAAGGVMTASLRLGGRPAGLLVKGGGRIDGGRLAAGETLAPLRQATVRWRLDGRRLVIREATARVGDGHLRLAGEAAWPLGAPSLRLALQASVKRVTLRPLADLVATVTGDLQLAGPPDDLTLRGRLDLNSVRYQARLDLERLLPRRNTPPLRLAQLSVGSPVALNVRLVGKNNLRVDSNVLEAEFQGDLTLRGSSARVGLLGNLSSLWARARYRDNTFDVSRASIDFVDEYRVAPEVNLQATTRACNMLAEVNVHGAPGSLQVLAQGQDEQGQVATQDVLSCLQFGLRLQDFAGNQRGPASFGAAVPGGLDALWTVSGMDERVKRLLPIAVDELKLTSGWSSFSQRTTARVLVGKEVGRRTQARYARSLEDVGDQSLSLEHRLTPHTAIGAAWLSVPFVQWGDFGVDMPLTWELP